MNTNRIPACKDGNRRKSCSVLGTAKHGKASTGRGPGRRYGAGHDKCCPGGQQRQQRNRICSISRTATSANRPCRNRSAARVGLSLKRRPPQYEGAGLVGLVGGVIRSGEILSQKIQTAHIQGILFHRHPFHHWCNGWRNPNTRTDRRRGSPTHCIRVRRLRVS